jgi:hypothetical protein
MMTAYLVLFLSQFHVINELTEVRVIIEYRGFMWESEFEIISSEHEGNIESFSNITKIRLLMCRRMSKC